MIPVLLIVSIFFNSAAIGFVIISESTENTGGVLGPNPAIMQDSYFARAPGLETHYGMIGDIPGGYSLYHGSPIQIGLPIMSNESQTLVISLGQGEVQLHIVLIAISFFLVPVLSIWILGRKSYGSTETR
jgi:hypothetical protein